MLEIWSNFWTDGVQLIFGIYLMFLVLPLALGMVLQGLCYLLRGEWLAFLTSFIGAILFTIICGLIGLVILFTFFQFPNVIFIIIIILVFKDMYAHTFYER